MNDSQKKTVEKIKEKIDEMLITSYPMAKEGDILMAKINRCADECMILVISLIK